MSIEVVEVVVAQPIAVVEVQVGYQGPQGQPPPDYSNAIVIVGDTDEMPTQPTPPAGKFYVYFKHQ